MWQKSLVLRRLLTRYSLLVTFLLFTIHCSLSTDVYAFCFEDAGKTYDINPSLLKSIAQIESNLNPKSANKNKNGSIDIGLMQINSFWIKTLGLDSGKLISDPCYNTMIGAKVLKQCIDRHGYTWEAVGCYNATSTPKKVKYSWKIFNRLQTERQCDSATVRQEKPSANSKLKPQNSELYFRVMDKVSNHEPSAISHEPKMEAQ
jgi:soluble lytic murein transglycosylase-like protein